jgi:hypothetical protein
MAMRHNSHHGGNIGGEPAYTSTHRQPSRTSIHIPAPEVEARASHFLRTHTLRKKIRDVTCNRGIEAENFVPQKAIREIWPSDRVRQFLSIFDYEPDDETLRYIRDHLLKILSILVAIDWGEWIRFRSVFLEPMKDPRHCRLDGSIPFPLVDLEDEAFLGEWGEIFYTTQHAFAPIEIKQGEVNYYPSWMRLPFIRSKSERLGKGTYGSVTKEVIAVHQFKWKESQSLNDV